ncbi:DNA replication protein [Secundilactobacillus pentosiphilus]|uniref:DNA replication protein n=1 Tax=Secundilactobacillus pentosiphilus TaxID=1714682 RepID=A0A1Z5IUJ3_9LACO|nr:ATP-binding protein [Secundilactobacillus pentosiphilus]GAX05417.1 DNA replication protein [Secundilactobacillus pentosiphilus]
MTEQMMNVGAGFSQAQIRALAKAKGIDLNHLPSKEELDQRTIEMAKQKLIKQKQSWFKHESLYSGNVELEFTFADWKPELQENVAQAKAIGNKAFKIAQQLSTGQEFNVVMLGTPGVGKTSLALAILNQLAKSGKTTMFVSTAELLKLINDKFEDRSLTGKIAEIKRAMTDVDVLVLDDFGTEGGLKFNPVHKDMQELMYQVSNARVDFKNNHAKGSTIITTNNTKAQLKLMYEPKFIDRVFPNNPEHQLVFSELKGVRQV